MSDTLSETFLPDITELVKRFRKYLTAEEFRSLKAAIKMGDFHACSRAALLQATMRIAVEYKQASSLMTCNALWEFMELRDEWTTRIHDEGGTLHVSTLVYRAIQVGTWQGVQVRYR